jgi:hypothetical protein
LRQPTISLFENEIQIERQRGKIFVLEHNLKSLKIVLISIVFVWRMDPVQAAEDVRIANVLRWLPAETVSISVVKGPIDFDPEAQPLSKVFGIPEPTFQYWALFPGLSGDISHRFKQRLGLSISCLVGDRSSHADDGNWNSLSEGWIELAPIPYCKFFFLSRDPKDDNELRQNIFDEDPKSNFSDEGRLVHEVKVQEEPIAEICMPMPNLIICTKDRSLMHIVLKRLNTKYLKRVALPAALPEWREAHTTAAYWGVRHFLINEPGRSYKDPACISVESLDRNALAVVYDYDKSKRSISISYLSTNASVKKAATRALKLDNHDYFSDSDIKHLAIIQSRPHVVNVKVPDDLSSRRSAAIPILDWLFGHRLNGL